MQGVTDLVNEHVIEWTIKKREADGTTLIDVPVLYILERPNFKTEAKYAYHLKTKVLADLELIGGQSASYRDLVAAVARDWASYQYEWGGQISEAAIRTTTGLCEVIWLTFKQRHDDKSLPRDVFDAMWRDRMKRTELMEAWWGFFVPVAPTPGQSEQENDSTRTSPN